MSLAIAIGKRVGVATARLSSTTAPAAAGGGRPVAPVAVPKSSVLDVARSVVTPMATASAMLRPVQAILQRTAPAAPATTSALRPVSATITRTAEPAYSAPVAPQIIPPQVKTLPAVMPVIPRPPAAITEVQDVSLLKKAAGAALSLVPGGGLVRAGASLVGNMLGGGGGGRGIQTAGFVGPAAGAAARAVGPMLGRAGAAVGRVLSSKAGRVVAGGAGTAIGWELGQRVLGIGENGERKRRRSINVLNPKALARANRRVCGFSDVARKTLRELGYEVSSTRRARGRGCSPKKGKRARCT